MAKSPLRMTMDEVLEDMRRHGQRISQPILSDWMASGNCPFAIHLRTGSTGRRTFMILRRDYEKWRDQNLGEGCTV